MSIKSFDDWELSEKGHKDAERHRKKVDKSIRENVRDVIAEEDIITKKRGRKVKVPIKGLKDWKFVHGPSGNTDVVGTGSGDGKPGDIVKRIKKKGGKGNQPGQGNKPGDAPGEDYIETEVDIDYLIEIMFEDLGLPFIKEKTKASQLVPKGWKFEAIVKKGIIPRLHKKKTMAEAIKRTMSFIGEVIRETNCEDDDAKRALVQSDGDINDAIEIVEKNQIDTSIDPETIFIEDEDLRYRQIEEDVELHSNAVVIAMMDTSGSMTTQKKYLARSMLFWLTEFLRKVYDNVEIRFITHTTDAKIVDEHTFFYKGESGGTMCYTAFEKANYLIDTEYPTSEWNVYPVYISDGEDWDASKTMKEMEYMLLKEVNMLAYTQIDIDDGFGDNILNAMKSHFGFDKEKTSSGAKLYTNSDKKIFVSVINDKKQVFVALKHFLFDKESKRR